MKKTLQYFEAAIVLIAIVAALSIWFVSQTNLSFGSVGQGQEYQASQLTAAGTTTLKTLYGAVGSVVVATEGSTGVVSFYATTSQATSSADLLFSFPTAASEGTYTYDVSFSNGLLVDVATGFNGDYVVTYR